MGSPSSRLGGFRATAAAAREGLAGITPALLGRAIASAAEDGLKNRYLGLTGYTGMSSSRKTPRAPGPFPVIVGARVPCITGASAKCVAGAAARAISSGQRVIRIAPRGSIREENKLSIEHIHARQLYASSRFASSYAGPQQSPLDTRTGSTDFDPSKSSKTTSVWAWQHGSVEAEGASLRCKKA